MKSHQFFHQYANLPIEKRNIALNFTKYGGLTMNGVFFQMEKLQDKLRPLLIEEKELLEIAEEFLPLFK